MEKNFIVKSLGCKQNQLEGQIIQNKLLEKGYKLTADVSIADIYILNSCTVTSHSDSESHYLINKIKKQNPAVKLVLTGCIAQTLKQHEDFDFSKVDLILGNSEKMEIEKYIDSLFNEKPKTFVKDIFDVKTFENSFLINPDTTRVSIKIQDGCNNRCSYCIIPYARGNSRSNTLENILKQIKIVCDKGIKEIVLTGIHIGDWGRDFNLKFINLLEELEKTEIKRYRLGSLYINELDDEIINFLSKSDKFCPHFHLSLQSMSNKVLKDMNRFYTVEDEFRVIDKLHQKFNLPFLGCDIIVGFPNETDEEFNETFENLKKANLSSIHVFPYSKRKNTKAYSMPQVQDSVKTLRCKKIMDLSKKLHKNFLLKNQNTTQEILIERKSPKTGLYSAVTKNYIKIHFKSDDDNLRHKIKTVDLSNYVLE